MLPYVQLGMRFERLPFHPDQRLFTTHSPQRPVRQNALNRSYSFFASLLYALSTALIVTVSTASRTIRHCHSRLLFLASLCPSFVIEHSMRSCLRLPLAAQARQILEALNLSQGAIRSQLSMFLCLSTSKCPAPCRCHPFSHRHRQSRACLAVYMHSCSHRLLKRSQKTRQRSLKIDTARSLKIDSNGISLLVPADQLPSKLSALARCIRQRQHMGNPAHRCIPSFIHWMQHATGSLILPPARKSPIRAQSQSCCSPLRSGGVAI